MSLAARQSLLARFLTDPEMEKRVRADPKSVASELGLAPPFVRKLAAIAPERVRSFRRSRVVKAKRRGG